MKRFLAIFTIAGATTFGLFAFMAYLISSDQASITEIPPTVVVDVIDLPEETKPDVIVRKQFQPPEPPPVMEMNRTTPDVTQVASEFSYTPASLDLKSDISDASMMSGPVDQDARPVVQVNPRYPSSALRNGTQGWVRLMFDINEIGEVINVKVIDSEPGRVFDNAAKQALKRWKYRPKSVDGKQVKQRNFTVQLDFKIDQEI